MTAVRTGIPYNPASLAEPVVYNIGKQTFLIFHHSLITEKVALKGNYLFLLLAMKRDPWLVEFYILLLLLLLNYFARDL